MDSQGAVSKAGIWQDPAYTINDRNINSAIWSPAHCAKIRVSDQKYTLRGYAYAGAGRPVHRVEVTLNNAQNWRTANIERFEQPDEFGQCWCWVFWSLEVPVTALAQCGEFAVRAWDDSQNCQPERPTWNLMGMMNNPWFRVKVHCLGDDAIDEIWFEHPTQVDNRHSIDKNAPLNPMNEILHLDEKGNLASPGWMERMNADVKKVYAPGKPEDLDDQEGWEREKQHIINPDAEAAPRPAKKKLVDTSVIPEARSGDGSLENVGIKLTGKFKSLVTNQCFDTEEALALHLKYLHDPKKAPAVEE
jgi:hypothetical protein